ncbi:hypothetical protein BDBG_04358 [Blastomyces gilchristii SLH14081]|uniref:Uncharacterized protein n=1 Tax=Blastomyces gilchristii (strain SLH14081) TaxID=559298 RepID=A0A179UK05_BLAGS|nr:uncharacterized protein BDBG_04358 [Blastomyces gilchristii SLH14081]OAT08406.1 hypothetical protein BDBG_04358 [Blastomyces gilchristii SLH14081]
MGSECSYDRGLFDGSIGGFLFEKSSEFVVERLKLGLTEESLNSSQEKREKREKKPAQLLSITLRVNTLKISVRILEKSIYNLKNLQALRSIMKDLMQEETEYKSL